MRRKFIKGIAVVLSLVATVSFVGCGKKGTVGDEGSKSKVENADELKGNVKMAVYPKDEDTFKSIITDFNEVYPNVEVELKLIDTATATEYLTVQAAAGTLPDIVNCPDVAYALSQGWVQDLSSYVEGDKDFEYVPKTVIDDYTLDGKLYSMPFQANTTGIIINLDLLEQLNMDPPSYDWTIDEFKEMAKKATTSSYSGINNLDGLHSTLVPKYNKELSDLGYNPTTKEFNLTDGSLQKTLNIVQELKAVPGLAADSLKNQELRDEGKEDDYQKKFGKEVDAFLDGKVLFGNYGCWALDWWRPDFNYDFYPVPMSSEVGYRQSVGFDNYFMMNTAEHKDATFAFLKWITYDPVGMTKQLEARAKLENPIPYLFIPPTSTPEVLNLYNSLEYIPDGLKYIYSKIDESYRGPKISPGFGEGAKLINEMISQVFKDGSDPAARLPEVEKLANDEIKKGLDNLKKEMSEFDYYK